MTKCRGCVALQAQLDEINRAIGEDAIEAHDGYARAAIESMTDGAVVAQRLLQSYRVQRNYARAVTDWVRGGYAAHGHCVVCGVSCGGPHDESCLYVGLRNAIESVDAEERKAKHD